MKYTNIYDHLINTVSDKSGDVNSDGNIDSSDALLVLQHSIGQITLKDEKFTCADVNKDNNINSFDALAILQYAVGQINKI